MFFLLNAVVVKTQFHLELPRGLEQLSRMSPAMVLSAGRELYANQPRLEHDDPFTARWYCTLLQQKFPDAAAARFYRWKDGYAASVAMMPLPELIRLWNLQQRGVSIEAEVFGSIWSGGRQVA